MQKTNDERLQEIAEGLSSLNERLHNGFNPEQHIII